MEVHIKVIGVLLVLLAFLHFIFPRYFNWKAELTGVSLINRQIMYVHTLFIALGILLMGVLCAGSADEIVTTRLGRRLSLGLGIFWTIRLYVQFFGYSPKLWKGKLFETSVHILFAILWSYMSFVFLFIYWFGDRQIHFVQR